MKTAPIARTAASIVAYRTDAAELKLCIDQLQAAGVERITVIDNSPDDALRSLCEGAHTFYEHHPNNLGYGTAHNIALRHSIADAHTDYHLVLNSDVTFAPDTVALMAEYIDAHPDTALLTPRIVYPDGRLQASVRMLPTPIDLFLRRFVPRKLAQGRRMRYELMPRNASIPLNAPYHQGSFMLLRCETLRSEGLFDERFFMYPEDIDLSRRLHRRWKTLYWPGATVVHNHRRQSYSSLRIMAIHIANMVRYFNKWGWLRDAERSRFNREVQAEAFR